MPAKYTPCKVTFHLDGTGLHYNPWEPIHLDALLGWVYTPFLAEHKYLQKEDRPERIPLPLKLWYIMGYRGFYASALFPEGQSSDTVLTRYKRFRSDKIELVTSGTPNLQTGPYRNYKIDSPLLLCHSMVAWAVGYCSRIRYDLKKIKFLGKKRNLGIGKVVSVDVEETESDFSLVRDGLAMRWLPKEGGTRLVRVQPPYWNIFDRVRCCEVLEPYTLRLDAKGDGALRAASSAQDPTAENISESVSTATSPARLD
jgi:hypothetical protein